MNTLQAAAQEYVTANAMWCAEDTRLQQAATRVADARERAQAAERTFALALGMIAVPHVDLTVAQAILNAMLEVQADTVARIIPATQTPKPRMGNWSDEVAKQREERA